MRLMSALHNPQLISVAQAIEILDATIVPGRRVTVSLNQALGLHLAADLTADRDDPPFDKSQMDGFALRAADATAPGVALRIVGDIPAGTAPQRMVNSGEAMSIMTGAPLPPGADAVIPVEQTSREGDRVTLQGTVKVGHSIARRGSDCAAGRIVLRKGTQLGPAQIAVAASVGAHLVDVLARPKVAVLSTGDEIVPVDALPGIAQIRNSNSHMLVALLQRLGCEVRDLGIVADRPEDIRRTMEDGLREDALFVTGGMSMGEYDYVPRLLVEMGVTLRITKLRIKPGKPFVFGERNGKFVFGLPGNPVSAFVCTVRLASRLLTRMAGGDRIDRWIPATLREALPANGPREFYQPAVLDAEGGVTPLRWNGSADIYTLAAADVLLVRAEDEAALAAGAIVRVLPLPI